MIQKCKFQKRNDPPICVISFLEFTFLDHFFAQFGGSIFLSLPRLHIKFWVTYENFYVDLNSTEVTHQILGYMHMKIFMLI